MSIQRWIEREASQRPAATQTKAKNPLTNAERHQLVDEFLRRNKNRGLHRSCTDPWHVHRTILALEAEGLNRPSLEEILRKLTEIAWGNGR